MISCYLLSDDGNLISEKPVLTVERSKASKILSPRKGACPKLPDGAPPVIIVRGDD